MRVVLKMALRRDDQFYFHLSSDGSLDVYPENKSSKFKVALKQRIDVGEIDWEVALVSIDYPYSWTNVGKSAGTQLKYFIGEEQEMQFPDWLCLHLEELIEYMAAKFNSKEKGKVWLVLDELKRVKFSCLEPTFDIGFSESLMRLLGFAGHPYAPHMTITAFERRQKHRTFLNKIWRTTKVFDMGDEHLRQEVRKLNSLEEFMLFIMPFVDISKVKDVVYELKRKGSDYFHEDDVLWDKISVNIKELQNRQKDESGDKEVDMYTRIEYGFGLIMYNLQKLMGEKQFPRVIKGVVPGHMNPVQMMYIYTNIVEPVDFNDRGLKVLKIINTKGEAFSTTHEEFAMPTYIPVQKGSISDIEVLIANDQGQPVPFQVGTVTLTLHFRKAVRYRSSAIWI